MNSNSTIQVNPTTIFLKEVKRLSKRYKSIKDDIDSLVKELKNNPLLGTDLGNGIRKIRITISSKNRGKSGGGRVITLHLDVDSGGTIFLLTIYDKSDRVNISANEIDDILKRTGLKE